MTKKQIEFVNELLYRRLLYFADSQDAAAIADSITPDIVKDIEETADPDNWHGGDVDMALGRLLKEKLVTTD